MAFLAPVLGTLGGAFLAGIAGGVSQRAFSAVSGNNRIKYDQSNVQKDDSYNAGYDPTIRGYNKAYDYSKEKYQQVKDKYQQYKQNRNRRVRVQRPVAQPVGVARHSKKYALIKQIQGMQQQYPPKKLKSQKFII